MRGAIRMLVCAAAALAVCSVVQADTLVEVWDAKLRVTRGTLQGVSDAMVTYFDENRAYQTLSRDSLVRVRVVPKVTAPTANAQGGGVGSPASDDGLVRVTTRDAMGNIVVRMVRPPAGWAGFRGGRMVPNVQPVAVEPEKPKEVKLDGPGWLWLTDGQKLKATFKGPVAGEQMSFNSERLGEFTVPVDKVSRFWPDTLTEPLTGTEGQDTLLLANGDRVGGFAESLDEKGIRFKPQGAEEAMTLGPAQVAGFLLSNPPATGSAGLILVTLGTGEVLGASSIKVSDDKVGVTPSLIVRSGGEPLEVPLTEVATMDFSGPAGRLVALKEIPRQVVGGEDFLGSPNMPVDNTQGTLLQAPVTVRYALPAGSARVLFTARAWCLPESREQSRKWTRFDASLLMAGQKSPVWKTRFEFGKEERVVLEAGPGPMDLVLDEGDNGPVLDRLLLADGYVLVKAAN